jgi:hypothetical protein
MMQRVASSAVRLPARLAVRRHLPAIAHLTPVRLASAVAAVAPEAEAAGSAGNSGGSSGGGPNEGSSTGRTVGLIFFGTMVSGGSTRGSSGGLALMSAAWPYLTSQSHAKLLPPAAHTQVATTLGLGTWQALRYGWKVELLEVRRAALSEPPLDLSEGWRDDE